jgi:hypothetical protein
MRTLADTSLNHFYHRDTQAYGQNQESTLQISRFTMELHLLQGLLDKKTLHFRQLRETKMVPEFYVKRGFRAS